MTEQKRVATCKTCGHTWNVEKYDGKRKRKCPACGHYQITYIDPVETDLTDEIDHGTETKIHTLIHEEPADVPDIPEPAEPEETSSCKAEPEKPGKKPHEKHTALITIGVTIILGLLGAGWLFLSRRTHRTTENHHPQTAGTEMTEIPAWRKR